MDTRGGTGYGVLDSGEDYGCSKACARTYPDCRRDKISKQSCVFYFIPMNQLEMFILWSGIGIAEPLPIVWVSYQRYN